ncbi:CoA transferase [Salinisphaera sp. T31B1]|uniref:CaiB/BaiF CoA transferase family protein n=1 Tax=Salinisphaera sp. T31B1 TaxID=727963 RepID=UPI00334194C4
MANPLLEGVRVLDLTRLLPGPYATQLMAQLGAEVIKIEDPAGGDYARTLSPALFEQVNRGKASVTLDLKQPDDVAAFKSLVADADVVIESFRPGVMERLGCGYETLRAINPRLVYAALTGYGQTGPMADSAGHDINYLALAGVLDQTGASGGPPTISNVQIADLAGGALTCTVGVLAALLGVRSSGHGSFVDSAMLDGALALQPVAMATRNTRGRVQPRGQDMLSGALPNYRVYRCRDGRYLAVGALEPKFFVRLLSRLAPFGLSPSHTTARVVPGPAGAGRPRPARLTDWRGRLGRVLADPARAATLGRPLHWSLAALFRTRNRDTWVAMLADTDACTTPVLTLDEALAHAQVAARGLVEDSALGCPLRFSQARQTPLAPSPALGADNERFLRRA